MKYSLRILSVLVLSFLIALLVYGAIDKGLSVYRNGYKKCTEMFSESTPYDVVVFGSSRTYKNIDPNVCDSVSGFSFYNAGMAGAKYFEISMIFQAYFEVHKQLPKYIVYNLDELNFQTDKRFFNPTLYFNFFNNSKIYNGFKEKDYPVTLYKLLPFMKILEFNDDTRNNALKGLRGQVNAEDKTVLGYSKMEFAKFKPLKTNAIGEIPMETYINNPYFEQMTAFCKSNHIQLIFVSSPVYDNYYDKKITNYEALQTNFKSYCDSNGYPLWRFDSLDICHSKAYFGDDIHLNKNGSNIFSKILGERIKKYSIDGR